MMKLLLSIALVSAFPLYAQQACDQSTLNKVDYMQCLDQQLEQTRRELTTWENNHLFKLEEQAASSGRQDGLKLVANSVTLTNASSRTTHPFNHLLKGLAHPTI